MEDNKMRYAATGAALALILFAGTVINTDLFPLIANVDPISREISTFFGAAFSLLIAFGAYYRPKMIQGRIMSVILLILLAISLMLLVIGLQTDNRLLVAAGSPFGGIGLVWFSVLAGVSLASLSRKEAMVLIPSAMAVSFILHGLLGTYIGFPDATFSAILYFVAVVGSYLLIFPSIEGTLAAISKRESPQVLDVTNPSSYLQPTSPVAVIVFLFNAISGLQATLIESMPSTIGTFLSALPVLLLLVLVVARKEHEPTANQIEKASFLLVIAGISLLTLQLFTSHSISLIFEAGPILILGGLNCFTALTYYLMAAIGARNPIGSLSTAALILAASWVGIGVGATIGGVVTGLGFDPTLFIVITAGSLIILVGYQVIMLSRFDFDKFISQVVSVDSTALSTSNASIASSTDRGRLIDQSDDMVERSTSREASHDKIEEQCLAVVQAYGLTEREGDVLLLLAHGRTSPIIQRELVITQNTVKSHVRHIYAKLGVHSQQELIDLVISSAK